MSNYIGLFVGGLIATGVLTFVFNWLLRKVVKPPPVTGLLAANALSLAVVTVGGGIGFANGGPHQFGTTFLTYLLPQIIWLVVGFVVMRRRASTS